MRRTRWWCSVSHGARTATSTSLWTVYCFIVHLSSLHHAPHTPWDVLYLGARAYRVLISTCNPILRRLHVFRYCKRALETLAVEGSPHSVYFLFIFFCSVPVTVSHYISFFCSIPSSLHFTFLSRTGTHRVTYAYSRSCLPHADGWYGIQSMFCPLLCLPDSGLSGVAAPLVINLAGPGVTFDGASVQATYADLDIIFFIFPRSLPRKPLPSLPAGPCGTCYAARHLALIGVRRWCV